MCACVLVPTCMCAQCEGYCALVHFCLYVCEVHIVRVRASMSIRVGMYMCMCVLVHFSVYVSMRVHYVPLGVPVSEHVCYMHTGM